MWFLWKLETWQNVECIRTNLHSCYITSLQCLHELVNEQYPLHQIRLLGGTVSYNWNVSINTQQPCTMVRANNCCTLFYSSWDVTRCGSEALGAHKSFKLVCMCMLGTSCWGTGIVYIAFVNPPRLIAQPENGTWRCGVEVCIKWGVSNTFVLYTHVRPSRAPAQRVWFYYVFVNIIS